jgi:glycosyltransferase involved in cell wall biosynthesis
MTAYNEETYLETCLKHIMNQNLRPELVLLVDDGSNDKTGKIISKFPVHSIRINKPKYSFAAYNMVRALNRGYNKILEYCVGFDFLFKIDADSYIPPNYIETLIKIMMRNPKLGIVCGEIKNKKIQKHRASDGARLYRRECWEAINGLDYVIHWDLHTILKAYHNGWLVRTIKELHYEEKRTHERTSLYQWYLSGAARYYLGLPVFHTLLASLLSLWKKPIIIGSLSMFLSHFIYRLSRKNEFFEREYYEFVNIFSKNELKTRVKNIIK